MNMDKFLRQARESSQVNVWMFFGNVFLTLTVLVLGLKMSTFNERVVLVPAAVPTKMTVGWDSASTDYYQSIGMTTAMLLGNITPNSADFTIDVLSKLLSPEVYAPVRRRIEAMVKDPLARTSSVSNSFTPTKAVFEPMTNKVFVSGDLTVRNGAGVVENKVVTYEFDIRIYSGVPSIMSIDSYDGDAPRTVDWKHANPNWKEKAEEVLK